MSKAPIAKQQKSEGSLFTFFSKSIGDLSDTRWRELIEEQDYDTLILEIREELLGRVADECYQKHLRCQVSKLLIECTHRAFQQIIPLHFYTYDDSHKLASSQESWIPDDEPVICKPDSWAKGNIPYNVDDIPKNKFQQTDNVSSEYNLIKCDEYPSSNVFDTYSNKCELEDGDGAEFLGSVDEATLETDEPELAFQSSVQFSNNDVALSKELLPSIQDIAIVRSMVKIRYGVYILKCQSAWVLSA